MHVTNVAFKFVPILPQSKGWQKRPGKSSCIGSSAANLMAVAFCQRSLQRARSISSNAPSLSELVMRLQPGT